MDNRFLTGGSQGVENGGMFNREQIQKITQYFIHYLGKLWNFMVQAKINFSLQILLVV